MSYEPADNSEDARRSVVCLADGCRCRPWAGVAEQTIGDRIFEPFVSTKDAGTGLGLPICRRIVEDHGGEIWAENRDGGGAVFSFRLPVTSDEEPASLSRRQA